MNLERDASRPRVESGQHFEHGVLTPDGDSLMYVQVPIPSLGNAVCSNIECVERRAPVRLKPRLKLASHRMLLLEKLVLRFQQAPYHVLRAAVCLSDYRSHDLRNGLCPGNAPA